MLKKIILVTTILVASLQAEELSCIREAHVYHSTGKIVKLSSLEASKYPKIKLNIGNNEVYLLLPSGKWSKHQFLRKVSGQIQYVSYQQKTYIRNISNGYWSIDLQINGEQQSIMLNCN
jgi:hypothetical protein